MLTNRERNWLTMIAMACRRTGGERADIVPPVIRTKLEQMGWVDRQTSGESRLVITDAGRAVLRG